ncbi:MULTISPECIES: hypothetical protein [unclassified Sinorhizobium]|uniref:hypothetical protein n=1 Tax=unclassified Sinorhizobium TaxID=2613772 RepID=UPI0024C3465A|nr:MULTISPECIES: hypothetical protein [unclassified Sinorhizobium]MDK1378219.1 hypothetical protein [Sinorhizobium sp. 6-70]MDK1482066.1 hypothetical protein [Sinorhizobium sp. 6-117]
MTEQLIGLDMRDALYARAYPYDVFDYQDNAAKLLLDPACRWAGHARCLALRQAGACAKAAAQTSRFPAQPLDVKDRVRTLWLLASAYWQLAVRAKVRAWPDRDLQKTSRGWPV